MPYQALKEQGHSWIEDKREQNTHWNASTTRTRTRAGRGKVYRWDLTGWNASCDPQATEDRAELRRLAERLLDKHGVKVRRDDR